MNNIIPLMQRVNSRVKVALLSHFAKKKKIAWKAVQGVGIIYAAVMIYFTAINEALVGLSFLFLSLLLFVPAFMTQFGDDILKSKEILKSDVFSLDSLLTDIKHTTIKDSLQKLQKDEIDELFNIELGDNDIAYISHCITEKGTITYDDLYKLYENHMTTYHKTVKFNQFAQEYGLHDKNTNIHQKNVEAVAKIAVPAVLHTQTFNSKKTL